jgi:hypothetical protein
MGKDLQASFEKNGIGSKLFYGPIETRLQMFSFEDESFEPDDTQKLEAFIDPID